MAGKSLSIILLFLICANSCAGLFYPKKTFAGIMIVSDPGHTSVTTGGWIKDIAGQAMDFGLNLQDLAITVAQWTWDQKGDAMKIAMASFRKILLDAMVNQIVTWIQGGGKPKFVTDWNSFLKDTADVAGGKALEELLGRDAMASLCQPNWAIKLNISLRNPKPFQNRVMCTLSKIGVNYDDFMNDFNNGGWKAWIKIHESQNNPYGLYMDTLGEKLARENAAIEAAKNEVQTGAGFLSDKVCRRFNCGGEKYEITASQEEMASLKESQGCYCEKWEVRTPGKMVADGLSKSLFKDIDWLIENEDWQSYVVAITDALISRLLKDGVMALTSSDTDGSDNEALNRSMDIAERSSNSAQSGSAIGATGLLDRTPPTTKIEATDSWHVKITSSEESFIYYTLDGSQPTLQSSPYIDPIEITKTTSIRWVATDYAGNKEGTRSAYLNPPFTETGANLSTAAIAVSTNEIALVAGGEMAIHYTTDGSDPTISSPYYVKKIFIENTLFPIKWFGVSTSGTQENLRETAIILPLPNTDFPTIADLTTPNAVASASSTSLSQFFTLNPSGSKDDDKTPKIIMYEWDFDDDLIYDWYWVDYNRDGKVDEMKCREGGLVCAGPTMPDGRNITKGFQESQLTPTGGPGVIQVKYMNQGEKIIRLRVTDDEGLYSDTSIKVNI
ncbi:MAG: chitobiase/beta-hexosaminidase C-terminal domain-containing protein [Candidatus Pacebacteria bacterium]|nr:chitobiase/beta-hexosaminidase C-terminal domain-containing protein [Candidatus Paceibacterota bacterium]